MTNTKIFKTSENDNKWTVRFKIDRQKFTEKKKLKVKYKTVKSGLNNRSMQPYKWVQINEKKIQECIVHFVHGFRAFTI